MCTKRLTDIRKRPQGIFNKTFFKEGNGEGGGKEKIGDEAGKKEDYIVSRCGGAWERKGRSEWWRDVQMGQER